jgi:plastocyanin
LSVRGQALDPEIGFAIGDRFFVAIGLGDVLIFCIYTLAAFKGYGRRGALTALVLVAVTGGIVPPLLPALFPDLLGTRAIPVQILFAPPAFLAYLWLSRSATERSSRQWLASSAARAFSPPTSDGPRAALALPAAAVIALVLAVVLAAGQPDPVPAQASGAIAHWDAAVTMRTIQFAPRRIRVRVGQTIKWTNSDPVRHNVVATAGADFGSGIFGRGGTYAYRATTPGVISYVCTLHPGMDGTITVVR